jgi:hypothetical protein
MSDVLDDDTQEARICATIDGWSNEQSFGLHRFCRFLRKRLAELYDRIAELERQHQEYIAGREAACSAAAVDAVQAGEVIDLIVRLREHVRSHGGPKLENGSWAMMLMAADMLERYHSLGRHDGA